MRFFYAFDRITGRWMPLIVVICLAAGVMFAGPLGQLNPLVPYIFAFMTFSGALKSNFKQVYYVVKSPLPLVAFFILNHVVIPLAALGLGRLLFPSNPDFVTGIVLEYVVPCAIGSIMWCVMSGGNISMTLCMIILDTVATPFILPLSLRILLGTTVSINVAGMMWSLLWMAALPAVFTMLLNQFTHDRMGKKLFGVMAPFGKIASILIIAINSTRLSSFILHMTLMQYAAAFVVFVLAVVGYILGWVVSICLRQDSGVTVSLSLACGMRNISAGTVLAAAYFPGEVMFPVMAGTLFQQALASLFSRLLLRKRQAAPDAGKAA